MGSLVIWLLGAALALLPFVPRTEYVMLAIWGLLSLRVVQRLRSGTLRRWQVPWGAIPLALFAATGMGQALLSGSNPGTWPTLILQATAVALVLLGADAARSVREAGRVFTLLSLGAAAAAAHGIWQGLTGVAQEARWTDAAQGDWTRVFSVFGNPNIFGTFLALVVPPLLLLIWLDRRWWRLLLALPVLGALALTYSRGAWAAAAVGMAIPLLYLSRRWLWAFAGAAVAAPLLLPDKIWSRLASISLSDSSIAYRVRIFSGTWKVIQAHMLWGVGPGLVSYRAAFDRVKEPGTNAFHSHNLVLQVWAERGLLGLVLMLAAFVLVFGELLRSRAPRPERVLGAAALASIAGALLQGMVDYIWTDFRVALLFWAVTGVGIGLVRGPEEKGEAGRQE